MFHTFGAILTNNGWENQIGRLLELNVKIQYVVSWSRVGKLQVSCQSNTQLQSSSIEDC